MTSYISCDDQLLYELWEGYLEAEIGLQIFEENHLVSVGDRRRRIDVFQGLGI